MPTAIEHPQAVVIDDNVYFRGAGRFEVNCDIHRYDPQTQQWTELPEYQNYYFTMTKLNHNLVIVGGIGSNGKLSNAVAVYSTSQKRWEYPYPPMNKARRYPAVFTYYQCLVVAGGLDGLTALATVEFLNTCTPHSQWLSTTELPVSCHTISSAVINDMLYLLGGSLGKRVLSVSLPALTQTGKSPAQWSTLSDAPLEKSTAITVGGSLLAVGGRSNSS